VARSRFRNVWPTGKLWRADCTCTKRHRKINLRDWHNERTAAWVADFARYLLYGTNTAQWHWRSGAVNVEPRIRRWKGTQERELDWVVTKLVDAGCLTPELASARVADYDRLAEAYARIVAAKTEQSPDSAVSDN
jgi:hypothetical protein